MPNPSRPYSKINFRSRKEKDKRNLAAASASPYGGDVIIKSKNKVANPQNKSQMLPRGSQVSIRKVNEVTKKPSSTAPGQSFTVTKTTPEKRKFIPGDYNAPGNPTVDRQTTVSLGKSMKENPAKTQARMEAQAAGKTAYDYKGKKEYSGRIETTPAKTTTETKSVPKLTMEGESYSVPKNQVITKSPVAPGDQGMTRGKTAKHVKWLGSKKSTKGLTSKPNTGGSTKTIWRKSPNKIIRK